MTAAQALEALGQALKQASADRNWDEVGRVDAQLARLLATLKGTAPDAALCPVLESVRYIHQQALACCKQHSNSLEEKMALSRRNHEGAVAYAAFMDEGEVF